MPDYPKSSNITPSSLMVNLDFEEMNQSAFITLIDNVNTLVGSEQGRIALFIVFIQFK